MNLSEDWNALDAFYRAGEHLGIPRSVDWWGQYLAELTQTLNECAIMGTVKGV